MKRYLTIVSYLFCLGLAGLVSSFPASAATVALATTPLATSTTTTVQPNVLLVLDDSGSMAWDHMPDDAGDGGSAVPWTYGYYGLRSSQCNEIYYNPSFTYDPPVDATSTSYANATFTGAWVDGFSTGSGTVNLNTSFKASQSLIADGTGQSAYYYSYSGAQTTQLQKNYNSTTNAFFHECSDSTGASPTPTIAPLNGVKALTGGTPATVGSGVFTKHRFATTETTTITFSVASSTSISGITVGGVQLMSTASTASSTSNGVATNVAAKITLGGFSATASGSTVTITGPTSAKDSTPQITVGSGSVTFTTDVFPDTTAANLTNFANWYSYYRTRMLMMKTAAGRSFSALDSHYRVGLLRLSSSNSPAVPLGTFSGTQRSNWYSGFYGVTPGGSTPLRTALSDAGLYYANKLGGSVTDPMQYSCQQNFAIMSTDGYWNGNTVDGFQLDGSTPVGNQDGTLARPEYDGQVTTPNWTNTYTRNSFSTTSTGCSGGKKQLKTQPQIGTCTVTVSGAGCTPASFSNNGAATLSGTCVNGLTAPSPSSPVFQSTSAGSVISGGTSDTLADVAAYYYQTDLRTPALNNCTSGASGNLLCSTPASGSDPYNDVFTSSTDGNSQQHMTTFTLGLGASGLMNYFPSYEKPGNAPDYDAVRLGLNASSTTCAWQTAGTTCNWPTPGVDASGNGFLENIDDLWHAAVNGHGTYFSATDPQTLSNGLENALAGIQAKKGAASAAATSTLNPVAGNNFAFFASYTTTLWTGNLEARGINTDTGVISQNATWCAENIADPGACGTTPVAQHIGDTTIYNCETPSSGICTNGTIDSSGDLPPNTGPQFCKVPVAVACTGTMGARVTAITDTRTILTANSAGATLINFDASYAAANPSYFNATKLSSLSQWTSLDSGQQARAANGTNLVNYLRGQTGFENLVTNVTGSGPTLVDNELFRARTTILADTLESEPSYIGPPVFSYPYPSYSTFSTAQASRVGTVYIGANDGMMHAFASDTGAERWAYVPSMVIPNMWKLADFNYGNLHTNFVNGSPIISDVCVANCANTAAPFPVWKTILVGGLNGGGRGYYALDVTDPTTPSLLWEFTTTAGIGKTQDDDLGYSYGQPVITQKTNTDGTKTWVVLVTSGYNNVSPGSGKGYLYVLNAGTGAIISKIFTTGAGTTSTPSGLAKIAAWNDEPPGNASTYVYGGDLLGNVWRFNINDASTTATIGTGSVIKFATLYSDVGGTNPQPITTTPTLTKIAGSRVIIIGTGKYLEVGDLTTTQTQTEYAIKDDNSGTFINPRNSLVQQTMATNIIAGTRSIPSAMPVNWFTGRGWFVDMPESGERQNLDSQLVLGTLVVATIVPSNSVCTSGGHGWINFLNYATGGSVQATGLVSKKLSAPAAGFSIYYVGGQPVLGLTDTGGQVDSGEDVPTNGIPGNFNGTRTLWRELMQ
jgi:type IV pilus assembly protein PilY1